MNSAELVIAITFRLFSVEMPLKYFWKFCPKQNLIIYKSKRIWENKQSPKGMEKDISCQGTYGVQNVKNDTLALGA